MEYLEDYEQECCQMDMDKFVEAIQMTGGCPDCLREIVQVLLDIGFDNGWDAHRQLMFDVLDEDE